MPSQFCATVRGPAVLSATGAFPPAPENNSPNGGPAAGEEAFGQVENQEGPVVAGGTEVPVLQPLAAGARNRRLH